MDTAPGPTLALPGRLILPRRSGALHRLLAPSLCDLFFLAVIAWSFMTAGTGWSRLLWDGDTALHIAIGNYVLDHGTVPVRDPFSFTQPDAPWRAVEWGTGVVFAALNRAWGLRGVVFLAGAMIAALITVLFRSMLAAGGDLILSIMLALFASNALSLHYHARPHLFTLLFLAVAAWIISNDRTERGRAIWLLPPIAAVWANLHPGFAVLFAYLGLVTIGSALEWWAGFGSRRTALRYAGLTGACALGTLINPFGLNLHREVFSYFQGHGATDLIQEFQAPTFRSDPQLYFMAFLFVGLGICGLLLRQRKYADALLIVAFAYESLISVRHSTVFVIVAAPLIARELSAYWRRWVASRPRNSTARVLDDLSEQKRAAFSRSSVWVVAGLAAIFFCAPAAQWPTGFDREMFPVDLAARHPELASARVFTTEQWADYLLFRNYPRQKDFYDDRAVYGADMFRPVAAALAGQPGWDRLLAKYHTDLVLLPPGTGLSGVLEQNPGWLLIDHDKTALLFRNVTAK
jgi:hypothetical protein